MNLLDNFLFIICLTLGIYFFIFNLRKIYRNINLGKDINRCDNTKSRLNTMIRVALGQNKMYTRAIPGILHSIVYAGFIIINIELLEIIIDGIFGTHRIFSFLGKFYNFLIASFEFFAFFVIFSVTIFWIRRNILKLTRLNKSELNGYPKKDANIILYFELILMTLFLLMNASDYKIQLFNNESIKGSFPFSQYLISVLPNDLNSLHFIEKSTWWLHILGILAFMNYLYYSKHLHILLAFPSTYFSNLNPLGTLTNLESVTNEVKLMMDPNSNPYSETTNAEPSKFGASDIFDLNKIQLLNAYSCTECGRCTDVCPANTTGKKLSPRKIMMDTRDRIEEVSKNLDLNKGIFVPDNKQLLNDYISTEEIWACTTCNACTNACPILLDPLSIIIDLRRYLVMEQSSAPQELNLMMGNIENNGAPWQFNQQDRANWIKE